MSVKPEAKDPEFERLCQAHLWLVRLEAKGPPCVFPFLRWFLRSSANRSTFCEARCFSYWLRTAVTRQALSRIDVDELIRQGRASGSSNPV